MKTGRQLKWLLPAALLVGVTSVIFQGKRTHDPIRFVNHWGQTFLKSATPEAFRRIPRRDRPELIFVRRFDSGEWLAARSEYSCTDGAGFDAAVFLDSRGAITYQIGHHFCGFEGLSSELRSVDAHDLTGFYAKLTNVVLRAWSGRAANQPLQPTAGAVGTSLRSEDKTPGGG